MNPRLASVRRVLGVGLCCFAIWLLFDARQLYQAAQASPLGVRRSVAVAVLRPIAAFSGFLHLSGPVAAAEQALGRTPVTANPPPIGPAPVQLITDGGGRASGSVQPRVSTTPAAGHAATPTPPPNGPPPVVPPTSAKPLRMLEVGDSLGEELGLGLGDVLGSDPAVRVIQKSVGVTGLSRPDYYNWPANLAVELRQYRPQVVIVMLGGNDAQSFVQNGAVVAQGTPAWQRDYAARVGSFMAEATATGAHVLWVGLPIMRDQVFSGLMHQLDLIYQQEAAAYPGVTYFSSWKLFSDASGAYNAYLPDASGNELLVRDPDGIHLTGAGYDRLATALVPVMNRAWRINLRP